MKKVYFQKGRKATIAIVMISALGLAAPLPVAGQEAAAGVSSYTYADLADLSDAASLVVRAEIRSQAQVEPERAPGLAPGHARLYVEARTQALIYGASAIGESLKYLIDFPLNEKGKAPKLKGQTVLVFAHAVPGRPGELQLVTNTAQLPADPALEARVKSILTELGSPDAPPQITGVRDSLSVAGNLAGESETQIFLDAKDGNPVSLSVVHRPGMAPVWGVSWTEIVDQAARPPRRDTLEWYRLACFLPEALPPRASLTRDRDARDRAARDYRFVLETLGPCTRTLPDPIARN